MQKQNIISSYLTLLLKQTFVGLATIIVSIILGRYMGPEVLGKYTMLFSYIVLFTVFSSLGVDITTIRELSKNNISLPTFLRIASLVRIPLLIGAVIFFIITLISLRVEMTLVLVASAILVGRSLKQLIDTLFYSKRLMVAVAAPDIVYSVIFLAGTLAVAFWAQASITGVLFFQTAGIYLALIISCILFKKNLHFYNQRITQKPLKEIIKHAKWFSVHPILSSIQDRLSIFFFSFVTTTHNLGLLAVGDIIKRIVVSGFVKLFADSLLPFFSERHSNRADVKRLFLMTNISFILSSFIIFMLAGPFLKKILILTFGEEYQDAVLFAYLFLLESMLFVISLGETTITKMEREDAVAKVSIGGFLLAAPLALILYNIYELKGIVLASFLVTNFRLLIGTLYCSKILEVKITKTYIPYASAVYTISALLFFNRINLLSIISVEVLMLASAAFILMKERDLISQGINLIFLKKTSSPPLDKHLQVKHPTNLDALAKRKGDVR